MQVTELVTKAYSLSGVVSTGLETVSAAQLSDGVDLLNDILSNLNTDADRVPYRQTYSSNFVTEQEKYFIPNLVKLSTLTFFNGSVRYSMKYIGYEEYMGMVRVSNVQSFPSIFTTQRTYNGTNIYVYFLPDSPYEFEVYGKFMLLEVEPSTDISTVLERGVINYLKYKLAEYICYFNNVPIPPMVEKEISSLEANIFEIELPDTTIKKISMTNNNIPRNIAQANMYTGILPG